MSLKKEIAKANLVFTAGRIISAVIAFFFSIILARLLQPHNFGLYSFCIVVVSFFILFTDFGMNSTLIRFVANYIGKGKYRKASTLIKLIFKYKIVLIILTGVLVSFFSNQIAAFIFNKPEAGFVVFFSGLVLVVNSLLEFFNSLFSSLKNFVAISAIQILQNIFKFVFVIGLILLGMSVAGAIIGLILSYLVVIMISLIIVYKKYDFIISKLKIRINRKILLTFTSWIFIGSIAGTIYALIDQLMISRMLDVEYIGFYKIGLTWMFSIIYLVPIAAYVMYPYFSGVVNKKQLNLMFFNSMRYGAIFIFPLAFLLSAFSTPFVLFLYKTPFLPVTSALTILAFVSILMVFSGILTTYFVGVKRPDIVAKIIFITLFLNITLNYFLIQLYGITGAALATFISKFIEVVVAFSIAVSIHKLTFKLSIIWKPLLASSIIYYTALFFLPYITNYFNFAFYGIILLTIYFAVMILIKGIRKQDLVYIKRGLRLA